MARVAADADLEVRAAAKEANAKKPRRRERKLYPITTEVDRKLKCWLEHEAAVNCRTPGQQIEFLLRNEYAVMAKEKEETNAQLP